VSDKEPTIRVLAQNRKARHEYEILEELECGVELTGTEVKSLRNGGGSIAESYAMVRKDELWLIGAHIPTSPTATGACSRTAARSSSGTSASRNAA
jgi:SsrA-binding protein